MKKAAFGIALGMAAILVTACSAEAPQPIQKKSGTTPAPAGGSSGSSTPTPGDDDDGDDGSAAACVTKADKGNATGVGAYCDKETRCKTGQFCTADFGAPAGAHFCTIICATDTDCGAGAVCFAETRGKGCVPNACVKK